MEAMRRSLAWVLLLSALPACRTGAGRGAPTPTPDAPAVATPSDVFDGTGVRTDRLARVPDLVGLSGEEATRFAERSGFEVVVLRVPGSPPGVVLRQDLAAGREAPAGSPIGLHVATGRGTATVPRATAVTPAPPAAPAPDATPPSMTTPRPEGIATEERPTAYVTPTDRGVVVPPVLDRTPEQARRILEDAGLAIRVEAATGGIPGRVMDQDPPAGARRPAGTEIVVRIPPPPAPEPAPTPIGGDVVPAGPAAAAKVVLPSVLDKTEAVARRILEELGFRVRAEAATSGVRGRVMDQSPSPGASLDAGAAVVIRIPGLEPTDVAPAVALDASGPLPETEFGSPDSAPSAAPTPGGSPPAVAEAPAVAAPDPPAPVTGPPPVVASSPIVAPPLVETPPPAAPLPAPTPPAVEAPPVAGPPPTVASPEPPASSNPAPTPEEVAPPESDDAPAPIFAAPRRSPAATSPEVPAPDESPAGPESGDALPPPLSPPPGAPAGADDTPAPPTPMVVAPALPVDAAPDGERGSELPAPPPPPPRSSTDVPSPPPPLPTPPAADPGAAETLAIPRLRAPLDGASVRVGARVVIETSWQPVAGATGYLLEVEELTDGVWGPAQRRIVKGTSAVVDLEPSGGRAQDFRWRVRTVVGRRGGRPASWAVFHAR